MPAFDHTTLEFKLPGHINAWVKECTAEVNKHLNEGQCNAMREIFKLAAQQNAQHVVISWDDEKEIPTYGLVAFGGTESPLSYRLSSTMREALSAMQKNILTAGSGTRNFPLAAFGVLSRVIIPIDSAKSPNGLHGMTFYITPSNLRILRAELL